MMACPRFPLSPNGCAATVSAAGVAFRAILAGCACLTSNHTMSRIVGVHANGISAVFLHTHQSFADVENNAADMERKMTFQQGVSGNPHGNRHRTRHLLNQEFMQALLLHFRQHGKKAIEKVARNQPAAYLKILALLVPREMKMEHSGGVKAMSDEEIEQAIEFIQTMLAARAGEAAKVIEGNGGACRAPGSRGAVHRGWA